MKKHVPTDGRMEDPRQLELPFEWTFGEAVGNAFARDRREHPDWYDENGRPSFAPVPYIVPDIQFSKECLVYCGEANCTCGKSQYFTDLRSFPYPRHEPSPMPSDIVNLLKRTS